MLYSAAIAVVVGIVVYAYLSVSTRPLRMNIVNNSATNNKTLGFLVEDIDGDEVDELIRFQSNYIGQASFVILPEESEATTQVNFDGEVIPEDRSYMVSDLNDDGFHEIVMWSVVHDSVVLNIVEGKTLEIVRSRAVCFAPKYEGHLDFMVNASTSMDTNSDGWKEIFFSMRGMFNIDHRRIYRYDYCNDELLESFGYKLPLTFRNAIDVNDDGAIELVYASAAPNNNDDSTWHYSDEYPWLFFFDQDLNEVSKPLKGFPLRGSYRVVDYDENFFLALSIQSPVQSTDSTLFLFSKTTGTVEKVLSIPEIHVSACELYRYNDQVYLVSSSGISHFNENQEFDPPIVYPKNTRNKLVILDEQGDYFKLVQSSPKNTQINLRRSDGKLLAQLPMMENIAVSGYSLDGEGRLSRLYVRGRDSLYIVIVDENPELISNIYYSIFTSISILLISVILFNFIILLQRDKQRKELELQLNGITNQFDAHFLYNTINSIGSFVLAGEKMIAYDYISKFSGVMRFILENAQRADVTLQEEIDFTREYVEVQKVRFEDELYYKSTIDNTVDLSVQIPKTLVSCFVQNSIKHHHWNAPLEIEIEVSMVEENIQIRISDNGPGMKEFRVKEEAGRGIGILREYMQTFNQLHESRVRFDYTVERKVGTEVIILIALK